MSNSNGFKTFMASTGGYFLISSLLFCIFAGAIGGLSAIAPEIAIVPCLICAFFGWRALTAIQPEMFLWMSLFGWLMYFLIKFILSALIGVFIAPFKIGKWIHTSFFNVDMNDE